MKHTRIIILAAAVAVAVSCSLLAEVLYLDEGKEAKIHVHVVDEEGNPVPDAKIEARFRFIDIGVLNEASYTTDANGNATVCGRCVDSADYSVRKAGYYKGSGGLNFLTGDGELPDPPFVDGKWMPYGETQEVVLFKIKEPVPMIREFFQEYKTPEANKEYGWDLEKNALVEPYGEGKVADFYVRHSWQVDVETGIRKAFTITFPNELDGYYIVDRSPLYPFTIPFKADPDAKYEKVFTLRHEKTPILDPAEEEKRKGYGWDKWCGITFNHALESSPKEELPDTKALIMRTRTKTDENGTLVSAHYSVMFGRIYLCLDENMIGPGGSTYFNPYENNMSLEYSEEKTKEYNEKLREERRKKEREEWERRQKEIEELQAQRAKELQEARERRLERERNDPYYNSKLPRLVKPSSRTSKQP